MLFTGLALARGGLRAARAGAGRRARAGSNSGARGRKCAPAACCGPARRSPPRAALSWPPAPAFALRGPSAAVRPRTGRVRARPRPPVRGRAVRGPDGRRRPRAAAGAPYPLRTAWKHSDGGISFLDSRHLAQSQRELPYPQGTRLPAPGRCSMVLHARPSMRLFVKQTPAGQQARTPHPRPKPLPFT
jgi:hypothetical protein